MAKANVTTTLALPNGMANTFAGNVNSLMFTSRWDTNNITYSFPTAIDQWTGYGANDEPNRGFEAAATSYKTAAIFALNSVASFTNLTFTEVAPSSASPASVRFGITADTDPVTGTTTQTDLAGWAYLPNGQAYSGDVWIKASQGINQPFNPGSFQWSLVIHEIGHALGLVHPFGPTSAGGTIFMDPSRDSTEWTIMAYRASVTVPGRQTVGNPEQNGEPQTWMAYDIAALQSLYGANFATNNSDTIYSWSQTTGQMSINGVAQGSLPAINRILMTIWDGGGVDTYDFSNYTTSVVASLKPGEWSTPDVSQLPITNVAENPGVRAIGAIANAFQYQGDARSFIERVIGGSGNDSLIGNDTNNTLTGGLGNDTLDGGPGNDDLFGGAGNDVLLGGAGVDSLNGGADDDLLDGGSGAGVLDGGDGNDTIIGGSDTDFLFGGAGSDSISGDAGDDLIRPGSGNDTVSGGLGRDIVRYDGTRAEVTVTRNGDGSWTVTGANAGTDRLFEVERISFDAGGSLVLDTTSISMSLAQVLRNPAYQPMDSATLVYRLYAAAYARTPDEGGLVFWANRVLAGDVNAEILAQQFRLAPEFVQKYGSNLDDRTYTDKLYSNVLGRPSDQGGLDFWTSHLTQNFYNRDQLMAVFAVSPENIARTTPDVTNGYWVV